MSNTLYRQNILDHYKNPQNFGKLEEASAKAHEANPLCGDEINLYLLFDDENKVKKVKFNGTGCAISMAAASMLTEELKGKTLENLVQISYNDIIELLGVQISPARVKCAELPIKALHNALNMKV